jgi:hypothetical protein
MTRRRNNDRVGGARNDERRGGKGAASPAFALAVVATMKKTAVEMPSLWKAKSASHRDL